MQKFENYIFSGYGLELAANKITNSQIEQAVSDGYLNGFYAGRIEASDKYKAAKQKQSDLTPFEYMANNMMGFKYRYYVVPFPPVAKNYINADTSLDLCVKAVQSALNDSGVHPEWISAWIVSTATPDEQAPGLAATLKSYFTGYANQTQTMTLTSACVGFNINVERAMLFLDNHPEANHVLVAHTEVMSELLLDEDDFVPFTTFGDAAAAVVISRVSGSKPEGLLKVVNYEDLYMIDFLGANKKGNLYMEPRMVKRRAVPNIANVAKELMDFAGWNKDTIDLFIPHQTGNAIVHNVNKDLELPHKKLYQEVQINNGNLSGASIPASLSLLNTQKRLSQGMKIVTSVAGLGGEYGGFAYVVPQKMKFKPEKRDLEGKLVFLTGATGGLGSEIAVKLAERGANLILQYNSSEEKAQHIKLKLQDYNTDIHLVEMDFSNPSIVAKTASDLLKEFSSIDYLVHTVAATGPVMRASEISIQVMDSIHNINFLSAKSLTDVLLPYINKAILFTGSVAEDAQFPGSSAYVASKKALHVYAAEIANKAYKLGIRCLYYMPGIINGGMANVLDDAQKAASMMQINQKQLIEPKDIADRMVRSLYLPKVMLTRNLYEGKLQVRKDGYMKY